MTLVVVIDDGKDVNMVDTRMYIHCSAPFYEFVHEAVVVTPLGQGQAVPEGTFCS